MARTPDPETLARDARIMDALLARFSWPVEEEPMHEDFEVLTDPARQRHVIRWPRESARREPSFGRWLHEVAHALLAEQAHPQFSRPAFAAGMDPALKNTYRPLLDACVDWFVQDLLMEVAPGPQGDDIDERFRQTAQVLRAGQALPSVAFVVDSGLALASFQRYRGLDIEASGALLQVVGAFLRTDPAKPGLFGLQSLARRLMAVFGLHTAALVCERGFERWRITPVKRP